MTLKFILCTILISSLVYAQKKTIQFDTYKQWKTINGGALSNDGNYAIYSINSRTSDSTMFVVKSLNSTWEYKLPSVSNPKFSADSKHLIGTIKNDSLFIIDLNTKSEVIVPDITNYECFEFGKKNYLLYLNQRLKKLSLKDLNSDYKAEYLNVEDYKISPTGGSILLLHKGEAQNDTLSWLNLASLKMTRIYKGENIHGYEYDNSGRKIAFLTKENNKVQLGYAQNYKNAKILTVPPQYSNISDKQIKFNNSGTSIFFYLENEPGLKRKPEIPNLQVWNYKDEYLQSEIKYKPKYFPNVESFFCQLNLATGKVDQLTLHDENITSAAKTPVTDEWVIVEKGIGDVYESFIHPASISYYLRSTTGKSTIIIDSNRTSPLKEISISPKGKNLIYYDQENGNYHSINTETEERKILTKNISDSLCMYITREQLAKKTYPSGVIGWIKEDVVLINSTFDLWYLFTDGKTPPKNVTNYQGEKNGIIFKILPPNSPSDIGWNKKIELASFNTKTKDQGFYSLKLDDNPIASPISFSSFQYFPPVFAFFGTMPNTVFMKSSKSKKYLILRQKSNSYPNYYISEDLITFTPISNYQPQSKHNWLTSELHTYKDTAGTAYEGILYKPEDFDSTKAYPILFQYYTKQSENLNQFPDPEPASACFSVPMAINRGYLVYLVDINSTIGFPGESATRSVLTAVKHLSQFKWVDTSKMAISGHSYGGYETNFIVTQTGIFRAAISGAGVSELISMPNLIGETLGTSWEWYYVYGPYNIGVRLTDDPNLYLQNSPLLMVKNISTPLLLVHNTLDDAVPYEQSAQLFMTLRGLKKPVWWLNYEKEGHLIGAEENLKDYNAKVFEFLDYYLKNGKRPAWMENHN